jgi:uncharacterized protein (TIGR02118 family)
MARVVTAYRTPKDKAAFDEHYFETHVPLAQLLPGLRKYEVLQGPGAIDNPEFHLVETCHFDDVNAAEWALASPQGQAAEADRRILAPGDDDVVMFLTDSSDLFLSDSYEMLN